MIIASLFTPPASDFAEIFERGFTILLVLSGLTIVLVGGLVLWFGVRYRAGAKRRDRGPAGDTLRVELTWAIGLFVAFTALFFVGIWSFLLPSMPRYDAEPIYVVGKQWMWKVQHPEGRREINALHLPVGEPVRLLLTSQDVIHSFYVPAFRLKQDALPDRFTSLSFTPTRTGRFRLYCAEYCGSEHSRMIGEVVVMRPDAFREWLASGEPGGEHRDYLPLAEHGSLVYQEHGCGACHGKRSTPMAPRLDGLYGRQSRLENGRLVTADANYIRESILRPGARIVAGYGPESSMPEYQGRIGDEDLVALVEFIRSIRDGWPEDTPAGEEATP